MHFPVVVMGALEIAHRFPNGSLRERKEERKLNTSSEGHGLVWGFSPVPLPVLVADRSDGHRDARTRSAQTQALRTGRRI